jgi:hypothetical protein
MTPYLHSDPLPGLSMESNMNLSQARHADGVVIKVIESLRNILAHVRSKQFLQRLIWCWLAPIL